MSSIDGITGVSDATALQNAQTTTYGGQDLGKDAFMSLLTTQMQNQDPLDPMKNEDFVAQLASFSSLEQLMGMNGVMQGVSMGINSLNNASMASLVGKDVVAISADFEYSGEGAQDLHYAFAEDVTEVTLEVKDADGITVHTHTMSEVEAGDQDYSWDGFKINEEQAAAGTYTLSVKGTNAAGVEVNATPTIHGTVTEMDYSSGTPQPSVNGTVVSLGDLLKLTSGQDIDAVTAVLGEEETGYEG